MREDLASYIIHRDVVGFFFSLQFFENFYDALLQLSFLFILFFNSNLAKSDWFFFYFCFFFSYLISTEMIQSLAIGNIEGLE